MRGLYIHIPFCTRKCHYCNYVSSCRTSPEEISKFLHALTLESEALASRYQKLTFDTLYIGGGTPSILGEHEINRLFSVLRSSFHIKSDAEITCEVNPESINAQKIKAYQELGINRISIGAQSFDNSLLNTMGRLHTAGDILKAFADFKEKGFDNISLDLIVRLPGQTLSNVEASLKRSISLGAKQVVVYDLNVHDKTLFGVWRKQGKLRLASDEEHENMWSLCDELLVQGSGYRQYELLSFAKPGFESKHNMIYWRNEPYLGLGPSAFSYIDGLRYQFAANVKRYMDKCFAADWNNDVEDRITQEDKEVETILTGLRLDTGINLSDFKLVRSHFDTVLPPLIEEGLLANKNGRIAFTARGRLLAEKVFVRLSRSTEK